MPHFHLYSAKLCPFVQRAVITLEEKNIPYDITYIDLSDKPQDFLVLSPFGKVPVLIVDHTHALFESAVINEYIDEVTPPPHLQVAHDPLTKALHRAWTELGSSLFRDIYIMMTSRDESKTRRAAKHARTTLQRLEPHIQTPWFSGDTFRLIDASIIPALQRFVWIQDIAPSLSITRNLPNTLLWTENALQRPSVQRSLTPKILPLFHRYIRGQGSPTRSTTPSWLSTCL